MNTLEKKLIAKQTDYAFGKDIFLLGKDSEGTKYWLEAPKWDCGWYWGFGYVETYTNNNHPSKAKDVSSHQHIDSSFIGEIGIEYIHNIFDCPLLVETTFTTNEGWILTELFKSFYLLKETAEFYGHGGTHTTTNPLAKELTNKEEVKKINEVLIPLVMAEILKMLKS